MTTNDRLRDFRAQRPTRGNRAWLRLAAFCFLSCLAVAVVFAIAAVMGR